MNPYIFRNLAIHACGVIVETSHVLKRSSFPPNGFPATATGTERGKEGGGGGTHQPSYFYFKKYSIASVDSWYCYYSKHVRSQNVVTNGTCNGKQAQPVWHVCVCTGSIVIGESNQSVASVFACRGTKHITWECCVWSS